MHCRLLGREAFCEKGRIHTAVVSEGTRSPTKRIEGNAYDESDEKPHGLPGLYRMTVLNHTIRHASQGLWLVPSGTPYKAQALIVQGMLFWVVSQLRSPVTNM